MSKGIRKRGSVLKVRGGCYNYIFKLNKTLNVATKIVVAMDYGQWTPNEGINQRNLKIRAVVADKICFGRT